MHEPLTTAEAKALLDHIAGDRDAVIESAISKLTHMLEREAPRELPVNPIERIWTCKIGAQLNGRLRVADRPMRLAVQEAFGEMLMTPEEFIVCGWGGSLTEIERASIEDRMPDPLRVEVLPSDAASVLKLLNEMDLTCDLPEDTRGRLRNLQRADL